jgi:septum formation protein
MDRLLLASESPRRRSLLSALGIAFECIVPDIDETRRDSLEPSERVLALAGDKASAACELAGPASPRLVLGADTLVCMPGGKAGPGEIALGKPRDAEEAESMIRGLAGRSHIVRTGLVLRDRGSGESFGIRSDTTVLFAPLGEAELEAYLDSGEWEGVAGAYRIQGLGACFVDRIEGSWTGVVGLPIRELYVILRRAGFRFPFQRTGH